MSLMYKVNGKRKNYEILIQNPHSIPHQVEEVKEHNREKKMNEKEYINVIIENIFATEYQKEYKREYYKQHRGRYNQQYLKWCRDNPKKAKAIRDRWRAKNPHYSRDYERKRKAVTESLIFQFLDNGVGSDIGGYIIYLRNRGVPEHHIGWFRKDIEKIIEGRK